jgi:alkyl hydroperoxide reductase subunit F
MPLDPSTVSLFTADACPHSAAAREFLARHGIPFVEQNVSSDPIALQRLIWLTGHTRVPAIMVGDQVVVGFDPDKLGEMFGA